MTKIFFDTEFTGLHKGTTLMSIGLTDEFGDTFYAELTDYDESQVNDWLRENVVANFFLSNQPLGALISSTDDLSLCTTNTLRGTREQVREALTIWLTKSEVRNGLVQMWSDCLAYDWVLFNDLLADYSQGYPTLPEGVHYIPMDICTLFELKGIDPDISREEYSGFKPGYYSGSKHNARHDAQVIKACYYQLMSAGASEVTLCDSGPATIHIVREDGDRKGIASFQIPGRALVDVLQAGCAHHTTANVQTSFTFQNW